MPRWAARRHGPYPHPSRTQASASGHLRERVLANVHEGPAAPERRPSARLPPLASLALTLVLGIAIGGGLMAALSSDPGPAARPRRSSGAQASLHAFGSHAELVVAGLPEPPIGEVYEVWLLRAGEQPQPTDALFTVASDGSGTVEVPGGPRNGVHEVMVTSEPLGGSTSPTGPVVLRVKASGAS